MIFYPRYISHRVTNIFPVVFSYATRNGATEALLVAGMEAVRRVPRTDHTSLEEHDTGRRYTGRGWLTEQVIEVGNG